MLVYITLLIICQFLGEVLVRGFALPIPGPVAGMVLLFVFLLVRGRVPDDLDKVSTTLLSHLSLMFIPAGVGVSLYVGLIRDEIWPLSAALILGTMATMAVTALVMRLFSRQGEGQ